jgi:hypothetical protein
MNTCAGQAGSMSTQRVVASADAASARPPTCRHREDPEGSHLDAAPQQDEHRDEVPYGKAYRAQAYDHGVFQSSLAPSCLNCPYRSWTNSCSVHYLATPACCSGVCACVCRCLCTAQRCASRRAPRMASRGPFSPRPTSATGPMGTRWDGRERG